MDHKSLSMWFIYFMSIIMADSLINQLIKSNQWNYHIELLIYLSLVPRPQPLMRVWWLLSASSHPKVLFKSLILLVNIVYIFMCTYAHCPNNTLTQPTSEDCHTARIVTQRGLLYSKDCYTVRIVTQRGLLWENCYVRTFPPSLPTLLLSPLPLYTCIYPNPFMYGWHDYKCHLTQVIY